MPKARYITAYFDTGGSETVAPILVTVGALSSTHKWARFDRDWMSVLAEFGVSGLHMRQLAHWQGEFASWNHDESKRRDFLVRLIDIMARGVNKLFVRAIPLAVYEECDRQFELTECVGGAYSLVQTVCLLQSLEWLKAKSHPTKDRFSTVIEQGDTGQAAFKRFIKEQTGYQPTFVPKIDAKSGEPITPLQACDFVAYEHRLLYSRALPRRKLARPDKWRSSLQAIRRRIPVDAAILEEPFLEKWCASFKLKRRLDATAG